MAIFQIGGTEPPFRANLLFGYVQSGSERDSFSGLAVRLGIFRKVEVDDHVHRLYVNAAREKIRRH